MQSSRRIYWVPLVMILMFLLDGIVMNHFSPLLIESGYTLMPRMVVITLVMLTFWIENPRMFWFAVIVGLMYDSYYSGILGIYMAIFAAIVRFAWVIRGRMSLNPFTLGVALVVLLSLTEVSVYGVYLLQGFTTMAWRDFVVQRLTSSLVLNLVLYYILYFPLKKFAQWIQDGSRPKGVTLRGTRRYRS